MLAPFFGELEERFEGLEDGVPDVVAEVWEDPADWPARQLAPLIEAYVDGHAYMVVRVRVGELADGHRICAELQLDRGMVNVHAGLGSDEQRDVGGGRGDRDGSVLVPVLGFVEKPEGIVVELLPCWVWRYRAHQGSGVGVDERDARVRRRDRNVIADRERDLFLLLVRQGALCVRPGERVDQMVEARPLAVECVTDSEFELVGKWLEKLCRDHQSPFAIGLLADSIATFVPPFEHCLHIADVKIGTGELTTVTERLDHAVTSSHGT